MQLPGMIFWFIPLGLDLNQVGDCCFWPMGGVYKHTTGINICKQTKICRNVTGFGEGTVLVGFDTGKNRAETVGTQTHRLRTSLIHLHLEAYREHWS